MHAPHIVVRRSLAVALLVAATSAARAQAPATAAGRVEGRVTLNPSLSARRVRFRIYADPGRPAPPRRAPEESPLRDVVVYLEGVPAPTEGSERPRAALAQRGERFVPHVLPVLVGTRVEFPNEDPLFHNVFSLSGTKSFDLGRYPAGSARSVTFDQPGVVQVFCHIHNDMSAVVLVLETPAYAVPDDAGRYAIDGVPPGDYVLVAWHERTAPIRRRVHVAAGGVTSIDVSVPVPAEDEMRVQQTGHDH